VWRDILLANREELLTQSKIFQAHLQTLELMLTNNKSSALEELIAQASSTRAKWHMNQPQD
jgi:prephenate dehydrogenase